MALNRHVESITTAFRPVYPVYPVRCAVGRYELTNVTIVVMSMSVGAEGCPDPFECVWVIDDGRLGKITHMQVLIIVSALLLSVQCGFAASITLTGTIRDFLYDGTPAGSYNGFTGQGQPDFQNALGDDRGIVEVQLGADGKPVYASATTTPTTHGKAYFDMWFRDTPGYNVSIPYTITATETSPGSGVYDYQNFNFFPIDGQLFGNQGSNHNYSFTYELPTMFTYTPGQSFSFTGDDDVWVFIDGKRVIDLGGVHGGESASVNLDTLGLTVGNGYSLNFFFAERHTVASNLRFETSIPLQTQPPSAVPEPGTLASVVLGLTGLALVRMRRHSH